MTFDAPPQSPRNGLGSFSLVLGLLAFVFAFFPIVGEYVAAPAAVLAIGLGLAGLRRVDKEIATNGRDALAGVVLGILSGFIIFLVYAASANP